MKGTSLLGSLRDCPEALDSDISQALCTDTVGSSRTLVCSGGVSYSIPWQVIVDTGVGIRGPWELWEFAAVIAGGGDLEIALHTLCCFRAHLLTLGSKEVQALEVDTLCWQHFLQTLFVH